jgi:hypothetical protein
LFNPAEKLNESEFKKLVREILEFGFINFGRHVQRRMSERNFMLADIRYILKNGKIIQDEFDEEFKNWKYTVSGPDIDGESGTVITVIVSERELFLVTVI